jgi:hypothetical protein
MNGPITSSALDFSKLISAKIEDIRPRLLDLTSKNPLIATSFSGRGSTQIQVVDELPDRLFYSLNNEGEMKFRALPSFEEESPDELGAAFVEAYSIARHTDELFKSEIEKLDPEAADHEDQLRRVERALKDRVREVLGMPKRVTRKDESLAQHARNHGINPSFELPAADAVSEDDRFDDEHIQTLLLAPDLERKLNGLITKARTAQQETGLNLMRAAFGFLEWRDPARSDDRIHFSPLVLAPINIIREKTAGGPVFSVKGAGEEAETNLVLREKFKREFSIELPAFEGGSLEEYFETIAAIKHAKFPWQVRRRIVFSVFPAARMAMYEDLDTVVSDFSKSQIVESILVGSEHSEPGGIAEEYDVDAPEVEVEVAHLVKKADASQFSVLVDVAKGKNLAVEGPPGTGKSDTIVNAIATALAKGKKVLFVAEKSAALQVVQSRLEAVGLGEFVLPLLAGKSTKEEFMRSVRERIGVQENKPRDLGENRDRYLQVRDKLSRYVGILASEWQGTGETVHRILGRAISTQGMLDRFSPVELSEHQIPNRELRKLDVEQLLAAVDQLENVRRSDAAARPYWHGTTCLDSSQFKISNILASTQRAAGAFERLAVSIKNLEAFGFKSDTTAADLRELDAVLDAFWPLLPQQLDESDIAIAGSLAPTETVSFVEKCESTQKTGVAIAASLQHPLEPGLNDKILRVLELCRTSDLKTLDATPRSNRISDLEARIGDLDQALSKLETLTTQIPQSGDWSVATLRSVASIVGATSRAVFNARSHVLSEPAAVSTLRQLLKRGEELRAARTEISQTLSLKARMNSADIETALVTIKTSGTFSFLSSSYRQAKTYYLGISKSSAFSKATAIENLDRLREQIEQEGAYEERCIRSGVFGTAFDGLSTNFADFAALADFYDLVDAQLPGFEHRHARDLLKSGDADLLATVPQLEGLAPDLKLHSITASKDSLSVDLRRLRDVDAELTVLEQIFHHPAQIKLDSLRALAESVTYFQQSAEALDHDIIGQRLGSYFKGWRTTGEEILSLAQVATILCQAPVFGDLIRRALQEYRLDAFGEAAEASCAAADEAEKLLLTAAREAQSPLAEILAAMLPEEAALFLSYAAQDREGLEANVLVAKARADIDRFAMIPTVDLLFRQIEADATASTYIEALLRRASAERVYGRYGKELSDYSGKELDVLRAQLKSLDDEIRILSRRALRAQLLTQFRPPAGISRGRVGDLTQMGLIEHLIEQRKIRVPVRDITRRAGAALQALKPVWMMSPLAVAQYIPKNSIEFDICIIDEASQMPPEDAIGALYRSRQAMIVGDTQQLPPSNFFRKTIADDNDDDDGDVVTQESVLEMANSAFRPRRMLNWHYRSRHSSLIRFSNSIVYQNKLVVFPSADEDNPRMGVALTHSGGIYKAGLNTVEAQSVVDSALEFMRSDPTRSLGVVAVNKAQAEFINERLQYEIARDKTASDYVDRWLHERDGLEEFFVKNLENVQGDERDVIFVSTVYGPPSEGGKVAQHFGPIAGPTGKRRLNVLFTRAREQIRTFTSMTPADITAEENTNAGAWMLKRWLEYSAGGPLDAGTGVHGAFDSPLEEYVASQIEAMGCLPIPQVGAGGYSIDLGIRHPHWPHGFILGVECDGATYHSSRSARDRDKHRQEVLEGLGWRIHRVWSTDWFDNPRREADRLRTTIADRLAELKANLSARAVVPSAKPPTAPTPADAKPTITELPLQQVSASVALQPAATAAEVKARPRMVTLGDTVRIRYLDRGQETFQFKIVTEPSAPERGIVNPSAPLAKSVLETEAGDEVEILLGSHIRRAVVESIVS